METLDQNGSVHNYSFPDYDMHNEESMSEEAHIAIPIILSIVSLLSLIGNILVVVISVFYLRLQSLTIIFILNLAVSDLLFTIGLMFQIHAVVWGFTLGNAACKAVHFIFAAGFYSNLVFLVLMSVQRYMSVVRPRSSWKKGRCFTLVLISAWGGSTLAAVPNAVYVEVYMRHCTYSSLTAMVGFMYEHNIGFVCAFLIMGCCFIRILQTIFKSPTNQRHRITGLAFFLVATYFICWAPFNIMLFITFLLYYQITHFHNYVHYYYAFLVCHILAHIRCCLNPVIYGLFCVKFRTTVREILQRRAMFNSAQMRMEELHSTSCDSLNNQVPDLDVNRDFSNL
ncbi:chemokine XC receptor 1-like [Neoarius graeffei]|uniref:chemokine XC receptor 1-like n=1 Tax=Neoarius graeffei TaxID=443677 RepID=UPI00298C4BEA|nr:chemokine XC receptor 1-like [Neoarius graeffei]